MSQIREEKQIKYFIRYAGSCLKIWRSIIGQQITHHLSGPGTIVDIDKNDGSIFIKVQFHPRQEPKPFLGNEWNLLRVFTHLTLPREVMEELETRYWNVEKEDLLNQLNDLAAQSSIDRLTFDTLEAIYNQLMKMHQTREFPEQTLQKIIGYRQKFMDERQTLMDERQTLIDREQFSKLLRQLSNLASQPSIHQLAFNTCEAAYSQLMKMHQTREFPEQTLQKIIGYRQKFMDKRQKLIDRIRFGNLAAQAMNPNVETGFSPPKIDDHDMQLVGKWCQPPQHNLDRLSLIIDESRDWKLGRLLSARSAEKVAANFYLHYGKIVRDISITQINKNSKSDWKDYDLNVDGFPIDVKNSRKSQKSEDRYTEHCIPQFKHSREKQEVTIAGVFSPYLWAFELLDKPVDYHQNHEIQFLGETTHKKLQALKDEFNDLVDFAKPNSGSKYFLPPWVFDYPEYVYTQRNKALKELQDFSNLASLKGVTFTFNLRPVGIAAGIDLTEILGNEDLDEWEQTFLNQLHNRIETHGLSLPFLFLTILEHFLCMAASSKTVSDFDPDKYKKFLFYKDSYQPLGIHDPLKTIGALIKALSTLWTAENRLIRKFHLFKLRSFNILQGKTDSDEGLWTTLIAYCGGQLEDGSACGKNPLVLGESKHCEYHKLICPECGFCCRTCRGEDQAETFEAQQWKE